MITTSRRFRSQPFAEGRFRSANSISAEIFSQHCTALPPVALQHAITVGFGGILGILERQIPFPPPPVRNERHQSRALRLNGQVQHA